MLRPSFQLLRTLFVTALLVLSIGLTQQARADETSVDCDISHLMSAINNAATGDILDLAAGCTYTLTSTYDPLDVDTGLPPLINRTLTINGNGAIIERDSAATPFRLFTVTAGGSLTLNNLTVRNGRSNFSGGAILNYGAGILTLNNTTVADSTATNFGRDAQPRRMRAGYCRCTLSSPRRVAKR